MTDTDINGLTGLDLADLLYDESEIAFFVAESLKTSDNTQSVLDIAERARRRIESESDNSTTPLAHQA